MSRTATIEPSTAGDAASELAAVTRLLDAMSKAWMWVMHDAIDEAAWFKLKHFCEARRDAITEGLSKLPHPEEMTTKEEA